MVIGRRVDDVERTSWFAAWCCETFFFAYPLIDVYICIRHPDPAEEKTDLRFKLQKSRADGVYSWKENPPSSPSFCVSVRCISIFLPIFIHLSVRLPFTDHFYADANIFPSLAYFSSFHLYRIPVPLVAFRSRFHAFVTLERLHEHCVDPIFADPMRKWILLPKERYNTEITK